MNQQQANNIKKLFEVMDLVGERIDEQSDSNFCVWKVTERSGFAVLYTLVGNDVEIKTFVYDRKNRPSTTTLEKFFGFSDFKRFKILAEMKKSKIEKAQMLEELNPKTTTKTGRKKL